MDDLPKAYARCEICVLVRLTRDFKLLAPCGHFLCNSCISRIFPSQTGSCPFCRSSIGKENFKPVLLDVVPANVAIASKVIEGMDLMDENAKLVSVLKAPAKLKEAAESLNVDHEIANSLQRAIAEFKKRIVPLFKETKEQKDEIESLRSQLAQSNNRDENMEKSTAKLRSLQDKMRENRKTRMQVEKDRDKALEIAKKAADELYMLRNENKEVKARLSVQEKEIDTLKGYLQQHKAAERAKKIEKKKMQRRIKFLEDKLDSTDANKIGGTSAVADGYVDLDDDNEPTKPRKRSRIHADSDLDQYPINTYPVSEGMPGPGFSSDWMPNKRLKRPDSEVKEATNFPLELDRFGRPVAPLRTGPMIKHRFHDPLR